MLGLCFIVLTSIKLLNVYEKSFIDELVSVAAITFMTSSILSFLSMKTTAEERSSRLENLADYFFIGGLSILFLAIVVITISFM